MNAVLVEKHHCSGRPEQSPVYYVFEALAGAKTRYSELEKMLYSMVMVFRKLRHYFTMHLVIVATTFPIREILSN